MLGFTRPATIAISRVARRDEQVKSILFESAFTPAGLGCDRFLGFD